MLATFKSELRKVLTIRSTYFILLFVFGLMLLFDFYVVGWHTSQEELLRAPLFLSNQVRNSVAILSLLSVVVVMLNVTHEYRHNMIMYTLTSNRSRTQVFLAKVATALVVGLFFTAFTVVVAIGLNLLAMEIRGLELGPQQWELWKMTWQILGGGLAYMMYAFILAMIIRVQVGAIVSFYLMFAMIENIMQLVLKKKFVYQPFQSLNLMMGTAPSELEELLSPSKAALVVSCWIALGLLVSWILFLRRDAN